MHRKGPIRRISLVTSNEVRIGRVYSSVVLYRDMGYTPVYGDVTPASANRVKRAIEHIAEVRRGATD